VAAGLVVGIFPQSDAKALESALSAQKIDLSKIKVVSGAAGDTEESALEFIDVVEDMESNSLSDDMTKGMGIMGDSGGTGVPGIGGRQATLGSFSHRGGASRYLAAFAIPPDEVDNFDQAVADGRAVVLYPDAGADAQAVVTAFRAAGLRNVRAY
jgi:rhodanese-related sulfurtransferase